MSTKKPHINLGGSTSDLVGRCLRALRGSGMGCDQIDKIKAKLEKAVDDDDVCDILEQYITINGR